MTPVGAEATNVPTNASDLTQISSSSVDLFEFADQHRLNLVIRRHPKHDHHFLAHFEGAFIKSQWQTPFVMMECGKGNTPGEAVEDYLAKIEKKILVLEHPSTKPRYIEVPKKLLFTGFA